MITREEILKGQPCPPELEKNLADLLYAMNRIRRIYGNPMIVNSGYRTPEHNAEIGGAKNSAHLYCQAVDIADSTHQLKNFCFANSELLEEFGLWIEHPEHTPTWIHFQIRPAKERFFIP